MTHEEITGRDGYIEAQAFITGIAFMQDQPAQKRETSNMIDMCRIARIRFDHGMLAALVAQIVIKAGIRVDLFPDSLSEEDPQGLFEADFKCAVDSILDEFRKAHAESVGDAIVDTPERKRGPGVEDLRAHGLERHKRDTSRTLH